MLESSDEAIFSQAIALPPSQREPLIRSRLAGHPQRMALLLQMLQAHESRDSFLDPAIDQVATEALAAPPAGETVGQSIGPYKLREEIGQGGMGVVFVAEREQPFQQKVALKIVKPGMDTRDVIARFSAERQALAMMDHPNIAKVLDAGSTPSGRPYFVMELVRGIPITQYCDQQQLTIRQRLQLFIDTCLAIQHAHQKGIIHRDIKPSNVLVTEHDGKPVPKVIDFGVAKAMNQRLTEHSIYTMHRQVVGTLQYMSPEQSELSGLDIDTRSDVYSLGLLLYELVTGSMPFDKLTFERASFDEKRRIIREEEPLKPSLKITTLGDTATSICSCRGTDPARLTRQIRGDLDWIVMKTLEKDRTRRYESALELARDARRFLSDQPVHAGPPSIGYRAKKYLRRNRRLVLTGAGVLLLSLVIGTLLLATWIDRRGKQLAATDRLSNAIETASLELGRAVESPIGDETAWIRAHAAKARIDDLLDLGSADPSAQHRARQFSDQFELASNDRVLARRIEEVLIGSATHSDRQSWTRMEAQLRDVFLLCGIDLDRLAPRDVAQRIRDHHSARRLSDALELWIATRAQLATMGGPPATRENMQPWADAIAIADPDPVRNGIRQLIYSGRAPTELQVDQIVEQVDLQQLPPRTLSWLANVYALASADKRCDQVYHLALREYPGDLMANFDFAFALASRQRWDLAIRYHMRCTALRPDVAGLWRALGQALRNNRELDQSREALEQSIRLQPGHVPTLVDLAMTQIEQEDFLSAERSLRDAIRFDPASAEAHAYLGRALMSRQQWEPAIDALGACIRLATDQRVRLSVPAEQWLRECQENLQ